MQVFSEIIGISLRNIDNQHRIAPFIIIRTFNVSWRLLKNRSGIKVVVGGAGFQCLLKKIMKRNESIDFGLYLEEREFSGVA